MARYILLLAFVCSCLILNAQASTQKTWAKYERYAQANSLLKETPQVVFLGNSITDFWVREMPDFFKSNNYVGRGISGQTTEQMLARFHQDVVGINPKIVVILAGINDIAQNNGPISKENILQNIMSMCDIAIANNITPVLCSILPCDYFVWRKDLKPAPIVVEMNKLISKYAKSKGYAYVDYYSILATPDGALNTKYTKDRCHPTREGYEQMISIVQNVLLPMLK